jgi:hypothetical protein
MRHGRSSESEGGRDEPLTWGAPYQRINLQPDFINDNDAWRPALRDQQRRDLLDQPEPQDVPLNPVGDIVPAAENAVASKPFAIGAAALKALFKAVKDILLSSDDDEPQPARRRRGETDKGFAGAWRAILRRLPKPEGFGMTGNSFLAACADAGVFLSDTHDPLNPWQVDETIEQGWQDDAFNGTYWDHFPEP